jgi:hypothetical protein
LARLDNGLAPSGKAGFRGFGYERTAKGSHACARSTPARLALPVARVPTMKEIRIWRPRIRRVYDEMGVVGFA